MEPITYQKSTRNISGGEIGQLQIEPQRATVSRPVFLVGAERSGTTMLRLMLDSHPDIAFNGEFEFLVDLVSPDGQLPSRSQFEVHAATDRVFQHWKLPMAPNLDFTGLAHDFLERKQATKGAKVAGATVHRHFDRLLYIWPEARFIHIVRDGRDVALSRIGMGWAGNLYTAIGEWAEVEALWAALSESLEPDRHMTLHYETLVEDPVAELQRISAFLGLQYHEAMAEYHRTSSYLKPFKGNSEKWRRIRPVDLAAAEFRAAPWLERAGYQPSQPKGRPTRTQLVKFQVQDRIAGWQFRQRRFGARLWLEDIASRRVSKWCNSVRQRVHAIEEQHLK